MSKFKQLNKNAWTTEEMKILFKAGKEKLSLDKLCKLVPDRNEKAIKNKLYHMGFQTKNRVIV